MKIFVRTVVLIVILVFLYMLVAAVNVSPVILCVRTESGSVNKGKNISYLSDNKALPVNSTSLTVISSD